jgi:hypothetical protein
MVIISLLLLFHSCDRNDKRLPELPHCRSINNFNMLCSVGGGLKFCLVPSQSTHLNVINRPGFWFLKNWISKLI